MKLYILKKRERFSSFYKQNIFLEIIDDYFFSFLKKKKYSDVILFISKTNSTLIFIL